MKALFHLLLLFMIISCSNDKVVYWCGDHPCINKKEKEAHFKKTMTVEIKELKKQDSEKNSEIEEILQQVKLKEKVKTKKERDLSTLTKLDEKRRMKEEKALTKQLKLDEKRRMKEEKALTKQLKLDEKRRMKEEKALSKHNKLVEKKMIKKKKATSVQSTNIDLGLKNTSISSTNFKKIVEKIINEDALKPYPDINDIPN